MTAGSGQGGGPRVAAVFASGGGTGLQAFLDHQRGGSPWRVGLVVSDRPDSGALRRARAAGVDSVVVSTRDRSEDVVARETAEHLEAAGVDVLFLAGYLKLVPGAIVGAWAGRILNVHPALLPAFGGQGMYGMNVHRAVVASGARVSGPTIHLVDEEYDRGRILAQWPVPVLPGDTPEELAARVLAVEHRLYPWVADRVCLDLAAGRAAGPVDLPDPTWPLPDTARSYPSQASET